MKYWFCFFFITPIFFLSSFANPKPFLGVSYRAVALKDIFPNEKSGEQFAIQILHILPKTAAKKSGLLNNDLILEIDGNSFNKENNRQYFRDYIRNKKVGEELRLKIIRQEEQYRIKEQVVTKEDLEKILKEQPYNEKIPLAFERTKKILNYDILLGINPFQEETNDVEKNPFLPYQLKNTTAPFTKELVLQYNLQASSDELFDVFKQDQKTNYGCRQPAMGYLHTRPHQLLSTIDKITQQFYKSFQQEEFSLFLQKVAYLISEEPLALKLPLAPTNNKDWQEHLNYIQEIYQTAMLLQQKAFAKISATDKEFTKQYFIDLQKELIKSFTLRNEKLSAKSHDIRLIIQNVDFVALLQSMWVLSHFTNKKWNASLKNSLFQLQGKNGIQKNGIQGVGGAVIFSHKDKDFSLVVGGADKNSYSENFSIIIDLAGDDYYASSNSNAIIIDLAGDDYYSSFDNYTQASAFFGTSLLLDMEGNDTYVAKYFAQASAVFGGAILYDIDGDDFYKANAFSQAYSFFGLSLLIDKSGNDEYAADIFSQSVATCGGVSLLLDDKGDDKYRSGISYPSTYRVAGSFHGASQGLGFGIRGYFDGGTAFLLDGAGKDIFQAGNFSQGSGYFFGLGVIKNFGNFSDTYLAYRYAQASAAHSALGVLIDDGGNDFYQGHVAAVQSAAWDKSVSAFWDKKGNDNYIAPLFSISASAHNGYAYFLDFSGKDNYQLPRFTTSNQNSYHGGSSLSFFLDFGGREDSFLSEEMKNNSTWKKRTTQIFWDK